MNPSIILRVASIISLLFAAGHTLGGRKDWSPMGDTDVLKAMRTVPFETMGVTRTYLDFFRGFGYSLSVLMLLEAVVLWQLSVLARADPQQVRPMIAAFTLASLACGLISWRFLFPVPAIFSAVQTLCLALAFMAAS